MSKPLYEALGLGDAEVAQIEGGEALIRQAVDAWAAGLRAADADGIAVTPTTISLAIALDATNDSAVALMLCLLSEAMYRIAFPREEMPPVI